MTRWHVALILLLWSIAGCATERRPALPAPDVVTKRPVEPGVSLWCGDCLEEILELPHECKATLPTLPTQPIPLLATGEGVVSLSGASRLTITPPGPVITIRADGIYRDGACVVPFEDQEAE